jgi:transcriptional regulator with GAF, ATPase, and Fis domain
MSYSVSAIRPERKYEPVRPFEDSADLSSGELIGSSASLQAVLKRVKIVAPTDSVVLIQGGTGTGKELIARAIHNQSSRRDAPFIKMNCAAIPGDLLERELFGHEKGAFTGAVSETMDRFRLERKSTLFLDEIGDLPVQFQPKLLRVLQEHEFVPNHNLRTYRASLIVKIMYLERSVASADSTVHHRTQLTLGST